MTKAEQDSLILDALELAIKTARVFYPDTKHISVAWIDSEEGEYLQVNNPYYDIDDDAKKLCVYRREGEDVNDFPDEVGDLRDMTELDYLMEAIKRNDFI